MKYHNAIELIQDAIQVLGDTLHLPEVQLKYGLEELRGQALEDVLYLAAECPEHESSVWRSAMLTFGDLNCQLGELNVAPLVLPSWDDFLELLQNWRLHNVGEGYAESVPSEGTGSDAFLSMLDPELAYEERVNRVMARMRQQKQIELDGRQPAPVVLSLTDEDKGSIEYYVRLAVAAKGIEEKSFRLLLEDIGDKYSWRFDKAAEDAWRVFFLDKVTNARSANAA